MQKFIYVFDAAARDELSKAGFLLLKSDEQNAIYVFSADGQDDFDFAQARFSYMPSDTLTF